MNQEGNSKYSLIIAYYTQKNSFLQQKLRLSYVEGVVIDRVTSSYF